MRLISAVSGVQVPAPAPLLSRALSARVLRTIRDHALVGRADRVAVALSGGPDSVALVWLLEDLGADGRLDRPVGLVHVNHGLRGAESDRDEAFCRALAERLSLPIEVGRFDVAARARVERRPLEPVARDVRYQFFGDAAARLGATLVATGHTLDDQAETVLLRLLRGAGARGLAGIRIRRGPFIRPLLDCRRDELRRFLEVKGERSCDDSSNLRLDIARNRVRHQLLPVIEAIAPGGLPAIARAALLSEADEAYFVGAVNEAAAAVVLFDERGVQLNGSRLAGLPPAIGRRLVRRAFERIETSRGISARHIEAVLRLARCRGAQGRLDLPGVMVERRGSDLVMRPSVGRPVGTGPASWEVVSAGAGRGRAAGSASFDLRATRGGREAWSRDPGERRGDD